MTATWANTSSAGSDGKLRSRHSLRSTVRQWRATAGHSGRAAGPAMTDKFRQAADNENFPYGEDTTPFIMVKSGKVTWAGRKADKIAMLRERGGKILAVW